MAMPSYSDNPNIFATEEELEIVVDDEDPDEWAFRAIFEGVQTHGQIYSEWVERKKQQEERLEKELKRNAEATAQKMEQKHVESRKPLDPTDQPKQPSAPRTVQKVKPVYAPRTDSDDDWSEDDSEEEGEAQVLSFAQKLKRRYEGNCNDLDEYLVGVVHALSELSMWKDQVLALDALPTDVSTELMLIICRLTRNKDRLSASIYALVEVVRGFTSGLLLNKEISRLVREMDEMKNASDMHSLDYHEVERQLKMCNNEIFRLRGDLKLFFWFRVSVRMQMARDKANANRKIKALKEHIETLKELMVTAKDQMKKGYADGKLVAVNIDEFGIIDDEDREKYEKKLIAEYEAKKAASKRELNNPSSIMSPGRQIRYIEEPAAVVLPDKMKLVTEKKPSTPPPVEPAEVDLDKAAEEAARVADAAFFDMIKQKAAANAGEEMPDVQRHLVPLKKEKKEPVYMDEPEKTPPPPDPTANLVVEKVEEETKEVDLDALADQSSTDEEKDAARPSEMNVREHVHDGSDMEDEDAALAVKEVKGRRRRTIRQDASDIDAAFANATAPKPEDSTQSIGEKASKDEKGSKEKKDDKDKDDKDKDLAADKKKKRAPPVKKKRGIPPEMRKPGLRKKSSVASLVSQQDSTMDLAQSESFVSRKGIEVIKEAVRPTTADMDAIYKEVKEEIISDLKERLSAIDADNIDESPHEIREDLLRLEKQIRDPLETRMRQLYDEIAEMKQKEMERLESESRLLSKVQGDIPVDVDEEDGVKIDFSPFDAIDVEEGDLKEDEEAKVLEMKYGKVLVNRIKDSLIDRIQTSMDVKYRKRFEAVVKKRVDENVVQMLNAKFDEEKQEMERQHQEFLRQQQEEMQIAIKRVEASAAMSNPLAMMQQATGMPNMTSPLPSVIPAELSAKIGDMKSPGTLDKSPVMAGVNPEGMVTPDHQLAAMGHVERAKDTLESLKNEAKEAKEAQRKAREEKKAEKQREKEEAARKKQEEEAEVQKRMPAPPPRVLKIGDAEVEMFAATPPKSRGSGIASFHLGDSRPTTSGSLMGSIHDADPEDNTAAIMETQARLAQKQQDLTAEMQKLKALLASDHLSDKEREELNSKLVDVVQQIQVGFQQQQDLQILLANEVVRATQDVSEENAKREAEKKLAEEERQNRISEEALAAKTSQSSRASSRSSGSDIERKKKILAEARQEEENIKREAATMMMKLKADEAKVMGGRSRAVDETSLDEMLSNAKKSHDAERSSLFSKMREKQQESRSQAASAAQSRATSAQSMRKDGANVVTLPDGSTIIAYQEEDNSRPPTPEEVRAERKKEQDKMVEEMKKQRAAALKQRYEEEMQLEEQMLEEMRAEHEARIKSMGDHENEELHAAPRFDPKALVLLEDLEQEEEFEELDPNKLFSDVVLSLATTDAGAVVNSRAPSEGGLVEGVEEILATIAEKKKIGEELNDDEERVLGAIVDKYGVDPFAEEEQAVDEDELEERMIQAEQDKEKRAELKRQKMLKQQMKEQEKELKEKAEQLQSTGLGRILSTVVQDEGEAKPADEPPTEEPEVKYSSTALLEESSKKKGKENKDDNKEDTEEKKEEFVPKFKQQLGLADKFKEKFAPEEEKRRKEEAERKRQEIEKKQAIVDAYKKKMGQTGANKELEFEDGLDIKTLEILEQLPSLDQVKRTNHDDLLTRSEEDTDQGYKKLGLKKTVVKPKEKVIVEQARDTKEIAALDRSMFRSPTPPDTPPEEKKPEIPVYLRRLQALESLKQKKEKIEVKMKEAGMDPSNAEEILSESLKKRSSRGKRRSSVVDNLYEKLGGATPRAHDEGGMSIERMSGGGMVPRASMASLAPSDSGLRRQSFQEKLAEDRAVAEKNRDIIFSGPLEVVSTQRQEKEKQLAETKPKENKSEPNSAPMTPPQEDTTMASIFLDSEHEYTPRASNYFHSVGMDGQKKVTQPPSMLNIK